MSLFDDIISVLTIGGSFSAIVFLTGNMDAIKADGESFVGICLVIFAMCVLFVGSIMVLYMELTDKLEKKKIKKYFKEYNLYERYEVLKKLRNELEILTHNEEDGHKKIDSLLEERKYATRKRKAEIDNEIEEIALENEKSKAKEEPLMKDIEVEANKLKGFVDTISDEATRREAKCIFSLY